MLRRWLMGVLALGLVGSAAELLLLNHYEDALQLVPLGLFAVAGSVLLWHGKRRDAASVRAIQATMLLFIAAGCAGIGLHFRGAAEFQLEINPAQPRWELVAKAMRTQAPPLLAPGIMLQLGLVGLVYAYRHPASGRPDPPFME